MEGASALGVVVSNVPRISAFYVVQVDFLSWSGVYEKSGIFRHIIYMVIFFVRTASCLHLLLLTVPAVTYHKLIINAEG